MKWFNINYLVQNIFKRYWIRYISIFVWKFASKVQTQAFAQHDELESFAVDGDTKYSENKIVLFRVCGRSSVLATTRFKDQFSISESLIWSCIFTNLYLKIFI